MSNVADTPTTNREGQLTRRWITPSEAVFMAGLPSIAGQAGQPSERSPLERLLDAFEAHIATEAASLAEYQQLSETRLDPVVTMLMRLIIKDETRHHQLLRQMAASLRDELNWTRSPDALRAPAPGERDEAALETTRTLLEHERESVRQLRALAKQQGALFDGLFELLLEVMAMDSEKHERILRFLVRRLEAQA